jgi:hypothetical protein
MELGEGRGFKLGHRLRHLWGQGRIFCRGFHGIPRACGWMARHVGSIGQFGGDLVQILLN